MIRRPPRSTLDRSSAASDVYKRQELSYISLSYGADTINNFVNDKGINMMNNELIQLKVINEFDNVIGEELEVDGILKNQLTIQNRIIESKWIPTYINLQTEKIEVKL